MKSRKSLGKNGSLILNEMSRLGKDVFSIEEVKRATNLENNILKETLSILVKQEWLIRLERGLYLIVPFEAGQEGKWTSDPYILASKLISPYYISHWSAVSYWGWTEQIPNTIFVTSTARKFSIEKTILNTAFRFIKVNEDKFFGITEEWTSNKKIKFSDKEKTVVDILDRPNFCGGIKEVAKCIKNAVKENQINPQILTDYITKIDNRVVFKRLGYISEVLGIFDQVWRNAWNGFISEGYSKLDPSVGKVKREFDSKWNLILNVPEIELKKVIEE
jgi:predicted transcriptional regulator of viral defense system